MILIPFKIKIFKFLRIILELNFLKKKRNHNTLRFPNMDRKVSKYFQLSPPLSEDTVVQSQRSTRPKKMGEDLFPRIFISSLLKALSSSNE